MVNVHVTVSASAFPVADSVPAGMATTNSVAMGKRSIRSESYSKLSVFVPSHFHVPGRSGSMSTGTIGGRGSLLTQFSMGYVGLNRDAHSNLEGGSLFEVNDVGK